MSPSIISFPTIFLISSIILFSSPKATVAVPSLVQKACSNYTKNIDEKLCLSVLESMPSITSTIDRFTLTIAIIEAGISNSTKTHAHVVRMLGRGRPEERGAYKVCKVSYDQVVTRFKSSLRQVRSREFVSPTYELLTASTDCVDSCESALATYKVIDRVLMRDNKIVTVFGISAISVIDDMVQLGSPPPHRR
ncbi:hypothetical protein AAHA92_20628 [Salvia divinorum]|uniref:Pectinesterase inhibitor domain-containing protein n=1 Tax=Salvia divinorum TaxID=28513 RepID=A0ABD1GL55_SALDI